MGSSTTGPPRVFCSHRSVDKPAVAEFARRLRGLGIDAWLDAWEIAPGDDFVTRINEGLETCQAVLIFFSHATGSGSWVTAEVSAAIVRMIEEGVRVIPVMIDDDAPVPALLRPRAKRGIDELDAIADAIRGRSPKPPLGAPPPAERIERLVVRLAPALGGGLRVTAEHNGQSVADVPEVAVSRSLPRSYAAYLRGELKASVRASAEVESRMLDADLVELGTHLGAAVFPGAVGQALASLLDGPRVGVTVEVTFEAPAALLSLPFEAARLADGRLPALEEGVCMVRRLLPEQPIALLPSEPPAGPLKILVAVGAPDEGQTPNRVLDLEAELQAVLDAVERANRLGNAQVRVLEVGHPEEIQGALSADAFHVLHLSGHGSPGTLELETEDGAPCPVGAGELARHLIETGRPLPLVFVSACHGGDAATDTASFAQGLLAAGIPRVVSMQGKISDAYATRLAGEFYGELLGGGERPLASRALALARRTLEQRRRQALARGEAPERHQAEYATASLFCLGAEQPLMDLGRDQEPLRKPPVHRVEGPVPQLSLGELIGRRRELREVLRTLRDHPRAVAAAGHRSGVVLTGMGGAGKSCLAGRAMARLAEEGWAVAAIRDRFALAAVARAVAEAVRQAGWAGAEAEAVVLESDDILDVRKLAVVGRLLGGRRLALVLDNFETNLSLTPGGAEYRDPLVRDELLALCEAAGHGKILVTCRHPLPGLEAWLREIPVGPLSPVETRKLLLRLHGFAGREAAEVAAVVRRIGGHPRMLEYVDALVRGGTAELPRVRELLAKHARTAGIDPAASVNRLSEAAREALLIGAQDILLGELLALADATGDVEVLRQAAVSTLPLRQEDLARALHEREPTSAEVREVRASVRRLAGLSLVTPVEKDQVWVHRWTAASLHESAPETEHRERCRRAGELRMWRVENESHSLTDGMEAVENFLDAMSFDRASDIAFAITEALERCQRLSGVVTFAGDVLSRLPESSLSYAALADRDARALIGLGYTESARARYQSLLAHYRKRVELEPGRADYQRDLAVLYERIGDVHRALGEGEMAHESYKLSLAIRKQLAAAEPERADYQRELAVPYTRIGDMQSTLGEGKAARNSYERSLAIIERLAAAEPGRGDYQRDLAASYDKVGDAQKALGEGEAARDSYERSLAIIERLATTEPERADYQHDLSAAYDKVGDVQSTLGEWEAARVSYERSLAIIERLATAEPERADYQRDLSVACERMGDVQIVLGDREAAQASYKRSLVIIERLVATEPGRADYQRDLSVAYERTCDMQSALGDGEAARVSCERSLAIIERLAAAEPGRTDYQHDLAVAHNKVGDVQIAMGESEAARASYERSLMIIERLAAAEPGRTDYQRNLGAAYGKRARISEQLGSAADAVGFRMRNLRIAERLWSGEPDRADLAQELAINLLEAARLDPTQAEPLATRAAQVLKSFETPSRLDARGAHLLQKALAIALSASPAQKALETTDLLTPRTG